jgi:hypothetical protein
LAAAEGEMAPGRAPNKNSFSNIHERYVMSDDFWNAAERRMFHATAFNASSLADTPLTTGEVRGSRA